MKKSPMIPATFVALSVVIPVLAPGLALADKFDIEPTHTFATFKVDHLERGLAPGIFTDVSGYAHLDGAHAQRPEVMVKIRVDSLDTFNKKRDEHLLGPDFFNAKRSKYITFKSVAIKKRGGHYEITGDLTIKGRTKRITARATRGKTGVDPWGAYRTGGNVTFTINRKDFGVGTRQYDAPMLGHEVTVDLYWEAVRS